MKRKNALISTILFSGAVAVQALVASDPVMHMLVQFPLLGAAGFVFGRHLSLPTALVGPALVLGIATILFWMLPRSLDGALTLWSMHFAKFTTLPLAAGLPLALAWPHTHRILRGLIKAEAISMLGILGFLYTHAPIRICNSYLVSDQIRLGFGFFWVAAGLSLVWSLPVFVGPNITWPRLNLRTLLNDLR